MDMERFKWYRRFMGGIWFLNEYINTFEGTRLYKWEREYKDDLYCCGPDESHRTEVYK